MAELDSSVGYRDYGGHPPGWRGKNRRRLADSGSTQCAIVGRNSPHHAASLPTDHGKTRRGATRYKWRKTRTDSGERSARAAAAAAAAAAGEGSVGVTLTRCTSTEDQLELEGINWRMSYIYAGIWLCSTVVLYFGYRRQLCNKTSFSGLTRTITVFMNLSLL